jgi:GLPGLI family protein
MKQFFTCGLMLLLCVPVELFAQQRVLSEATIYYAIRIESGSGAAMNRSEVIDQATGTVYVRGSESRTDLVSALGSESVFHDARTNVAAILKEYSGQKLRIDLTSEDWLHRNRRFDGVTYTLLAEEKSILNQPCKKASAQLKDGSNVTVFYATQVNMLNKEYDPTFKSLPGIPLYYEVTTAKMKVIYAATQLDLTPIATSRFEIPRNGYRVMPYRETLRGKE